MEKEITLKIIGMHCTACAMNIDGELEDSAGVIAVNTNYAKAQTKIKFNDSIISPEQIKAVIKKAGYDTE